jgi:hypothetical protein
MLFARVRPVLGLVQKDKAELGRVEAAAVK